MADHTAELALLIGSRICHDLISPAGAILNGLELLELTGLPGGPEYDLITHSAQNANARLRFFRIAYGRAGGQGLGRNEIVSVLEDMTQASRLSVTWEPAEPQARGEVRLAFLAIQCCESAMPQGGHVSVMKEGAHWCITAESDRMRPDPAMWERLEHPAPLEGLEPAQVQFVLLRGLLADAGRKAKVTLGERTITLRF